MSIVSCLREMDNMSWKYEQQQARCQWANECRSGFLSLILICICIRCNAGGDVGILNPHQDLCSNGNPSQIYHKYTSLPASQIYHTAGRMNDLCGVAEIEIPQKGWMIASQNPNATNFLKLSGKEKICPKSHFVSQYNLLLTSWTLNVYPVISLEVLNLVLSHNVDPFLV